MNKNRELIKNFIIENFLFGDDEKLNDETDLFKSGIIDSTGIIELVSFIESSLSVKVHDDELVVHNFYSINSITSYLDLKSVKQSA
jgi:hypothetical protein